jgi:uncharacterized protein YkwD
MRPRTPFLLVLLAAWAFACAPPLSPPLTPPPAPMTAVEPPSPPTPPFPSSAAPFDPTHLAAPRPEPTTRRLGLADARRYMVQLINRDRATLNLAPVALDEGAPTHSGQAHAEDMARNGYLGHWGTDGSVPEERYTEAGGSDMVMENASCFIDEQRRTLDHDALIDVQNLDQAEDVFFHEQPPNDGHRKNILKPWHKRVGLGIAQPRATPTEVPVPCFAQEFVDAYGTYAAVPASMRVGETLHVEGAIAVPATFAGVGLARVDAPRPVSISELNRRRSYPVPAPYQMYWPPGFQTPIPVQVNGNRFAVSLPLSDAGRAGMYEVSVWATVPGTRDLVMVSLRTIQAR